MTTIDYELQSMTTITIERELLEQALDALNCAYSENYDGAKVHGAKAAIRAALTAPATAPEPVATVAEVHMSRYTLEWTNGPLPEGTELYAAPQARPERNPMTDEQVIDMWHDHYLEYGLTEFEYYLLGKDAAEAFHGIK